MFKNMKSNNILSWVLAGTAVITVSCSKHDPQSPGLEFMPDMYHSVPYETYDVNPNLPNGMSAQPAPAHTIPVGFDPYPYPNTPEGYEAAGVNLKNPLVINEKVEAEGKELFNKMCKMCHGEKGDGQGTLMVAGDHFPVPTYHDAAHLALSEGKMFHSITYGKGLMGSHASQLSKEDRWKIVAYIKKLQGSNGSQTAEAK